MALTIEITKINVRNYQVKLSGMLDTEAAALLDRRMKEVIEDPNVRAVRMDLHDLTYISSMGLGSFAKIRKALAANGGVMVTVGAQPQIAHVFDIVKMLPKETVFASRQEADEYLAAIQSQVIEEQTHPNADPSNPA